MNKKSLIITLVISTFMLLMWCSSNEKEIKSEVKLTDNQNQEQRVKSFWLDFSAYNYEWFDSKWKMNVYSTGWYSGVLAEWKWVFYYWNGQIALEWNYVNWYEEWVRTWYIPTYWNYLYYLTWESIVEQLVEKPNDSWIEKEPTWWLDYVMRYEKWVENWLSIGYGISKKMDTNERYIAYQQYFENWHATRIDISWIRYSFEEISSLSDEEFKELISDPIQTWYYYLLPEKTGLKWWESETDRPYEKLDSLEAWTDNGKPKWYWSDAVWSWDELIDYGNMIYWYPNWNLQAWYNILWIDKDNNIVMDWAQRFYNENWEISAIWNYSENIEDWLSIYYDEDENVYQIEYYENWELVMDSKQLDSWLTNASMYYDAISNDVQYCIEWIAYLPNSGQSQRYINEWKSALDVCKKAIKVANIIWDYNWDSLLKNAAIDYMSWIIYENEIFIRLKEIELNQSERVINQENDTEIIQLKGKISEAEKKSDILYDKLMEVRENYITRYS